VSSGEAAGFVQALADGILGLTGGPPQQDEREEQPEQRPEWTDCPIGRWRGEPLTAGRRIGGLKEDRDLAFTLARGTGQPSAVIREAGSWAVYALEVEGRFTQRSTEVIPGTGIADITSVEPVAGFVTSDGFRLLAPGPRGHDLSHKQAGPRDDEGAVPFEDWTAVHGEGMEELEGQEFLTAFEVAMRDTALFALKVSQGEVRRKQAQLSRGLGVEGGVSLEEMAAIRLAAGQLADLDSEIELAELACDPVASIYTPCEDLDERLQAERELDGLRSRREDVLATQPMLRRVGAARFARLGELEMLEELGGDCGLILRDIGATRERLLAGKLPLWSVQPIVTATAAGLGVGGPRAELLQARVARAKKKAMVSAIGLAALSVGLGLAALAAGPLGAPAWATAALTVGAGGVGIADAVVATERYLERKAASNTGLDREQALIPDDLQGEWAFLVLAWVGIALDVADVVQAVRLVRVGQRTIRGAAAELGEATGKGQDELAEAARARGFDLDEADVVREARALSAAEERAAQAENFDFLSERVVGRPPPASAPAGYSYRWSTTTDGEELPELVAIARKVADDNRQAALTVDGAGKVAFARVGRPKIDRRARYVLDDLGRPARLPTAGAKVDSEDAGPLLGTRRRGLAERDQLLAAGDKVGAGKALGRANRATEELGVKGAKAYMEARDPGAKVVFEGEGAGTFDLVYEMSSPPPDFVVVEAKGGAGSNSSSRKVGEERYQQGRPEYAEDVLQAMVDRGKLDKGIAAGVEDAIEEKSLEYIEVRQAVTVDGSLGQLTARQYDLNIEEAS
jgi:hypothetical protein